MSEKLKKSKLPDLNECSTMASKLFKDIRKSLAEIIAEYREKRANDEITQSDKK